MTFEHVNKAFAHQLERDPCNTTGDSSTKYWSGLSDGLLDGLLVMFEPSIVPVFLSKGYQIVLAKAFPSTFSLPGTRLFGRCWQSAQQHQLRRTFRPNKPSHGSLPHLKSEMSRLAQKLIFLMQICDLLRHMHCKTEILHDIRSANWNHYEDTGRDTGCERYRSSLGCIGRYNLLGIFRSIACEKTACGPCSRISSK